jgi:prepilin-type N-terminal cleavage/methylation domain-containing protein
MERTVSAMRSHSSRGFSLIELLVAMTVTLIVSGAVYGLLTAGNTAFRREPALTDRQQNIRVAMDLISRDVLRAGYGLPQFAQTFTDDLDGLGSLGPGGDQTDELEIFAAADCPVLNVCEISEQGTGSSVTTRQKASECYSFPTLVILADPEKWGLYWANNPGGGATSACPGGGGGGPQNGHFTLPHGQDPLINPPGGLAGWVPQWMLAGQAIRYRVSADAAGVPNLERSAFGGQVDSDGNSTWEVVARGIEDLQVQYLKGSPSAPTWDDVPGLITCGTSCGSPGTADYATLIRRVRIRLSARALEPNLQGQTTSAVGSAVRGQLVTEVAPRAAAATLESAAGEF